MANSDRPERPRAEPEIIPPDRGGGGPGGRPSWPPHDSSQGYGAQRVYVARISPLGFALFVLAIGLLSGVFLFVLIGAALLWIPLVAIALVVAFLARLFRR
jgi:hypothetical protein